MEKSLKLGMPRFQILEDQVLDNPAEYAKMKSVNTTRVNKGNKSTLKDFFQNLQKDAFTSLKKKKCEKSQSIYGDKGPVATTGFYECSHKNENSHSHPEK